MLSNLSNSSSTSCPSTEDPREAEEEEALRHAANRMVSRTRITTQPRTPVEVSSPADGVAQSLIEEASPSRICTILLPASWRTTLISALDPTTRCLRQPISTTVVGAIEDAVAVAEVSVAVDLGVELPEPALHLHLHLQPSST
jgi:hypothetical protein